MGDVLARGANFMWTQARLLDRHAFAVHFEDGPTDAVVAALRAYQNADGGFGSGLEADLRAPVSQPIHVEIALQTLCEVGAHDAALVERACAFLETVTAPEGAVSPALRSSLPYPAAAHWRIEGWAFVPGLNPTAGIAARLHELGVENPWRERATEWCLARIENETFSSAHTLKCVFTLLAQLPDRDRAEALFERVAPQLADAEWFTLDTGWTTYTLTPLHFAPSPTSPAKRLFSDELIEAHLDDLLTRQKADGGWPVLWDAPGPAAVCEWRGRWTLDALLTLRAYDRL